MAVTLMPHQVIGVEWMLNRERETTHPGGILADAMGLGKTVQMITTIVANPPSDKTDNKLTLIVVPAALIEQWRLEIVHKTNDTLSVIKFHGAHKPAKEDMETYRIVITCTCRFPVPAVIIAQNLVAMLRQRMER